MKAECILEKFKKGITIAGRMVGKNVSIPALSSIKIVAEKNHITLSATNVSIGIEYTLQARVSEPGTVIVPAQLLLTCMQNIPGDQGIILEKENENVRLSFKGGTILLKTVPSDDFPTIPHMHSETSVVLPIQHVVQGMKSVLFAASQSEIKPELASVYIYSQENTLYFVATDAFRLSEKKISLDSTYHFPDALIPVKNAQEIMRTFGEMDEREVVTITFSENQIAFTTNDGCYITSRLIAGTYPNYQMIIPKNHTTECIALKSDILIIIKTLMALSDRDFRVDIRIDPKEKKCTFSSQNPDVGEGVYSLEASLKGEQFETRINIRHLSDILNALVGDSVIILFSEPSKPIIIRDANNTHHLALMMPISR